MKCVKITGNAIKGMSEMPLKRKKKSSNYKEFREILDKLKKQGITPYRIEFKDQNYLGEMITEYRVYITKEDYIQALEEEIKEIQTNILKWEGEIEKKKKEIEEIKNKMDE